MLEKASIKTIYLFSVKITISSKTISISNSSKNSEF